MAIKKTKQNIKLIKRESFTTDGIKLYLRSILRVPRLSPAEEIELGKKSLRGNEAARKKLINANLRLVIMYAKRYVYYGMPFLDLIEEGNIGLINAAKRFSPNKGCRFATYASIWIKQSIIRALANQTHDGIRFPIHLAGIITKYLQFCKEYLQKNSVEPTLDEITKKCKISVDKVTQIIKITEGMISLETPVGDEKDKYLKDILEDPHSLEPLEALMNAIKKEELMKLIDPLSEVEQKVIFYRFGLNDFPQLTLEKIGKILGVTRERIRQIELSTMRKLKHGLNTKKIYLKEFLRDD
ncbi:MAG: sigma-70 family RNA polymerase sigma factor [Candidatus Firestonebacteria bacterium]